ncbi:hypothetical protein M231_02149 [Tremella mesenterica]|uniref:Uncharacterized protein n=1 Tax=Tremella mesenterica TaxID=5217 RepID=A0A4V1M4I6_TREME|nr:hypothetical protein M231_02149 [Tremella mesenterica]
MSRRVVIPATIHSTHSTESQPFVYDHTSIAGPSRGPSYGSTNDNTNKLNDWVSEDESRQFGIDIPESVEEEYMNEDDSPIIQVSWKYMSRLYLLVPLISLLWLALLILLVTFAWPPTEYERTAGQKYPHPFLPWPFLTGIFASCTVQILREPIWVISSFLTSHPTPISTIVHTLLHELLRLSTLPIIVPSPVSGFHSSYYLGLGWGTAEVTWGVVKGWEQLTLYEDIMPSLPPPSASHSPLLEPSVPNTQGKDIQSVVPSSSVGTDVEEDLELQREMEEEEELFKKVDILERMRARRELEEVIGIPFPNIPFPLHLLWRLDTLLLNLGLTLIISSFYFNPRPIYHHPSIIITEVATVARGTPSKWLWLAWTSVAILHLIVNLTWKVVGRVGVGAVTWGGLIVALGSVFAGLGCWGGLV